MIVAFILLISTVFGSTDDCIFTVPQDNGKNETFDLSPLMGVVIEGADAKVSTYKYHVAVCSNQKEVCQDIMTGKALNGAVYQYGGEPGGKQVCWDVLAFWDSVVAEPLGDSPSTGAVGLKLQFKNGDECRNAPRKTTINLRCTDGNETVSGIQDTEDSCHFIMDYATKYACGGSPKPPTPGNWGLNGTFSGEFTCEQTKCTLNPKDIQLRGDCEHAKIVANEDGIYKVYDITFDACDGYSSSGRLISVDGEQKYNFDINYLEVSDTYELTAVEVAFPHKTMFKVVFTRIGDEF